jgi:GNAT superfamily N-acetyltransferase
VTDFDLQVGDGDAALDSRLSDELDRHNFAATGHSDARELTVQVRDPAGELAAGLSGWTWGTAAGIGMVWVREDQRGTGVGARLMEAAEVEAVARGCRQMTVSSFTFQAPDFYRRQGYVEFARTDGIPVEGEADVHFRKELAR